MNLFLSFEFNTKGGRDFAVGDIHGKKAALFELLAKVSFDFTIDRLFAVGDLVDRGEDSEGVLALIEEPWFFSVRGNHEQMILSRDLTDQQEIMQGIQHGSAWSIYCPSDVRAEYRLAIGTMPIAIQVGDVGIVHADVPFGDWQLFTNRLADWHRSDVNTAIWDRRRANSGTGLGDVKNIRAVICGHSVFDEPTKIDNVYHLDTGACFDMALTLMDIRTLEVVASVSTKVQ